MLVASRPQRENIHSLLDDWSDWVYRENRGELKSLGVRSWLGELVKNNNNEKKTHYQPIPVLDIAGEDEKMQLVDNAVRSLPSLQRQTIMVEYLVRSRDRQEVRSRWLKNSGRTYNAHRKMLSTVKDLLWLALAKKLDKEQE